MKILVINVSLRPNSLCKFLPVGLAYVATAIKNAGYEFDLLDIDAYRMSEEEIDNKLKNNSYDIVCMGCVVTGYKIIKSLCEKIKKYSPNCKIIVGNSVATSIPNILLENTKADIAVIGEGDCTIVDLLNTIKLNFDLSCVAGICFKREDKIIKTEPREIIKDISKLPFVCYDIFDIERYIEVSKYNVNDKILENIRALPVNTARGCVNNCSFCYHVFKGQRYRYRNPESVIREVEQLISKYSLNYIQFWDELTFFSKKQADNFVQEILDKNLKFYWTGECRANLFTEDEDINIINKMKESGCVGMQYSLESADEEILKQMNKNITTDQFLKQSRLFQKAKIPTWTSIVVGYPQETKETIRKTFECCINANIYPSTGYLLPQPGSKMYEYAVKNGFVVNEEEYLLALGDRQDIRLNMTSLSDEELEECVLEGLIRCNEVLNVGLDKKDLIKTGHFKVAKEKNIL